MDFLSISLELLIGFGKTAEIFGLTLLFSLPLGLVVTFLSTCRIKIISIIFKSFIWIIRGTPLMLQVIAVYYGPALLLGWGLLPRMIAVLIAFIINYACYFSEIYRGGINGVPKGQFEAGSALGMTKSQVFFKIILLQVIKLILAPIGNEIITLVKDTSLARVIVVAEILKVAQDFTARGIIWPLFYTAIFYLAFVGVLTLIFNFFKKKLKFFEV